MSNSIKDIIDSSGLNIDYHKVMNEINKAIGSMSSNNKIDIQSNNREIKELGMITIKNPEGLNTGDTLINGEWGITYGGRDLTIDVDNYGWVVRNRMTGKSGYYIVERELIKGSWLNVRWGIDNNNGLKERREVIDKSRLKDKEMIKRDMVIAILNTKSEPN